MSFTLPQNDGAERQQERRAHVAANRELYQLDAGGGMPPGIVELPDDEHLGFPKVVRMFDDLAVSGFDLLPSSLDSLWDSLTHAHKTFAFYDEFYAGFLRDIRPMPSVHDRWKEDREFARQRLNGVNPVLIERCTQLPDVLPVDAALLAGLLPEGATLAGEMAAGRVYISDYAILDGIPAVPGRYLAAPVCLFHVAPDGRLMPLAIRLERDADAPVFTPNDPPGLWLAVKMYAQSSDAAYHEVASHLLRTHLVSETVYVCMMRNLAPEHPLHELLKPHFWKTLAINHAAKTKLIVPGGPIDETMAAGGACDKEGNPLGSGILLGRAWKAWRWDRYDLLNDLSARGVDDAELLPGYHYRDDALALWKVIGRYVQRLVGIWYAIDLDVTHDTELQAWVAEMAASDGGQLPGLPNDGQLQTIAELERVLTQIIFTASAEHASVNNGQFDCFGFVPNVPGALTEPMPRDHTDISEGELCDRMPDHHKSAVQIAMVHLLSAPTELPLGTYHDGFFHGVPDAEIAVDAFRTELDALAKRIDERNAQLDVPYPYLNPRLVGQSIAV
jgi:arachidonate 5-lipoxygenase